MENTCGVLGLCFFSSDTSPAFFSGHLSLYIYSIGTSLTFTEFCFLLRRHLFLKLFLNREDCRMFWVCQFVGQWFVVISPFPLPVTIPPQV